MSFNPQRNFYLLVLILWLVVPGRSFAQGVAPWVGTSLVGHLCSGKPQGPGPFDYLQRDRLFEDLEIVERFHFQPNVEQLVETVKSLSHNLDYTLRAWPNHHRALNSMMRLQLREPKMASGQWMSQGVPPVECYFFRAISYSQRDATANMLLAMYLHRINKYDLALEVYQRATSIDSKDLQIKYNLALLLVDMENYDRARQLAKEIYAADFPLVGLQRKLERAGKW